MKFIVKRTSLWSDEQPIKEAKKVLVPYWHTRLCSEEYFNKNYSKNEGYWRSKGKNHKELGKNKITRQEEDREKWEVEINSLEELLKFSDKYGEVIISQESETDDLKYNSLEIYDDYRE